jgi:hypothetical protein
MDTSWIAIKYALRLLLSLIHRWRNARYFHRCRTNAGYANKDT